jgi:hypothetical protein
MNPFHNRTRRHFLRDAAVLGGALGVAPYIRAADPAKKYRTALIGCGWWGKNILKEAIASGSVKVVGLCDVDANVREVAADQVSDLNGDQPKTYNDYRELLEKEKPEIVLIATPDHWHALQTIAAVKAGGPCIRGEAHRPLGEREPGHAPRGEGRRPDRAGRTPSAYRATPRQRDEIPEVRCRG